MRPVETGAKQGERGGDGGDDSEGGDGGGDTVPCRLDLEQLGAYTVRWG